MSNLWKLFILSFIWIFIFLLISFILYFFLGPQLIYGCLYGLGFFLLAFFIIWLSDFYFKKKEFSVAIESWIIFLTRITFYVIGSLLIIFVFNSLNQDVDGVELILKPINFFTFSLVYFSFNFSVVLLIVYDWLIDKIIDKKRIKMYKANLTKSNEEN